jgi:hypothetical protein
MLEMIRQLARLAPDQYKSVNQSVRVASGIRIHFICVRIRIQHFRLNTDPDPIRIQGFNDQKLKENYS